MSQLRGLQCKPRYKAVCGLGSSCHVTTKPLVTFAIVALLISIARAGDRLSCDRAGRASLAGLFRLETLAGGAADCMSCTGSHLMRDPKYPATTWSHDGPRFRIPLRVANNTRRCLRSS